MTSKRNNNTTNVLSPIRLFPNGSPSTNILDFQSLMAGNNSSPNVFNDNKVSSPISFAHIILLIITLIYCKNHDSSPYSSCKMALKRVQDLESVISNFVPIEFQQLIAPSAFALPLQILAVSLINSLVMHTIMAIFPNSDMNLQAINAVKAAVLMMRSLDFMSVGINTGKTIIGTENRMEPTALGDAVNLASRTQQLCKEYQSRILITQFTMEAIVDSVTEKSEAVNNYENYNRFNYKDNFTTNVITTTVIQQQQQQHQHQSKPQQSQSQQQKQQQQQHQHQQLIPVVSIDQHSANMHQTSPPMPLILSLATTEIDDKEFIFVF
ncbi:hypothetical protein ACTFIV_007676 [Dictyostelium citrinum]